MYGIQKRDMDDLTRLELEAIEGDLARLNRMGGEHGTS